MLPLRLAPLAFGLALGILWGLGMLVMGLSAHFFMFGPTFVSAMGVAYIGYTSSIVGSIIGGVIGFVNAFVGGVIIAWLYNVFARIC